MQRDERVRPAHIRTTLAAAVFIVPSGAWAQSAVLERLAALSEYRALLFAALVAVIGFAVFCIVSMVRVRERLEREREELAEGHTRLRAKLERVEALSDAEDQAIVSWDPFEEAAFLRGSLPPASGAPQDRATFLAFGRWMTPATATLFERAVERLREHGEAFDITVETRTGATVETQGRATGSIAFVRFVELTGTRAELARMQGEVGRLSDERARLLQALDAAGIPVWLDEGGTVTFSNEAYAQAVEADLGTATHLLQTSEREAIARAHEDGRARYEGRHGVIWAGTRRVMDIVHVQNGPIGAGLAVDRSDWAGVADALERERRATGEIMDRLASGIVAFDASRHIRFHNGAFTKLWDLDDAQLEGVSNAGLLDLLRSDGRIAEPANFHEWRDRLLTVYSGRDTFEDRWQLPDGRTLSLVIHPADDGGATWIFEDITEAFKLRSQAKGLLRVREETLDALEEAVAVFGADGQLKLSNPAFASMWGMDEVHVTVGTPVSMLSELVERRLDKSNRETWSEIAAALSDHDEARDLSSGELELAPKGADPARTVRWTLAPLPGGQTMATFLDVSDSRRVENALRERASALQEAQATKSRTLRYISKDFREPLTTILGFSDMLRSGMAGEMAAKQVDYIADIATSAGSMFQTIDNTLDLAALAEDTSLDPERLDVAEVVEAACESVADMARERRIALAVTGLDEAGEATLDPRRARQIAHNMLAHAVRHSPPGGTVRLGVEGSADDVAFTVRDDGREITGTTIAQIVAQQEADEDGDLGLGLSLVATLADLHGGRFTHEHDESGTAFRCVLPREMAHATGGATLAAE